MSVHKGEVKKVASSWLINHVGIIVEALKVLVEVRQLWLTLVLVSSINTLLGKLEVLTHNQVLNEVLVALSEVSLDSLGEPSVLLWLLILIIVLGVLLREIEKLLIAWNAVGDL